MPINFSTIGEVRFEHHEDAVNKLLAEGWIILREPAAGLRRVERNEDGRTYLVDIPYREVALGRRRSKPEIDAMRREVIEDYKTQPREEYHD